MDHQTLYNHVKARGFHPDPIMRHVIAAAHMAGLDLADACTLLEKESDFQNVVGSDRVRNPVKGGRLTRRRYFIYKRFRRMGFGDQGMGYTQLTFEGYQDHADRLGGCWRAYPNLLVGFTLLASLIRAHGRERGAAMFNGSGADAEAYGRDFVAKHAKWQSTLA